MTDAKPSAALFAGQHGLGFDAAAAIAHLRAADETLAALMERIGPLGLQMRDASSIFLALAEAIVYQQLNGKAAAAIFGRVRDLFPEKDGMIPERLLKMKPEKLRGAGLSNSKMLALQDLARRSVEGSLPTIGEARLMPDEEVIQRLVQVRGIGRWTSEMLLIFRLGRPDILPVDDFGVRKGFANAFNNGAMPTPKELAAYGERWKPYRTAAAWYLWRAADTVLMVQAEAAAGMEVEG